MTILRVKKDKASPYVILHKSFLEDPEISLKLKGFLAYCLTKPDDWKFHIRQMATVLKEGKDAIYSIIDEGIEYGYIERDNQKKSGKFQTSNYVIHETKIKINSTVSGFPDTESPDTESQTLLTNKRLINEKEEIPPTPKGESITYGKFVSLTKEEFDSLRELVGSTNALSDIISDINDYISSSGRKPYKDYAATIRLWWKRSSKKENSGFKGHINENKAYSQKVIDLLKHRDIEITGEGLRFINHGAGGDFFISFNQLVVGFREQVIARLRKMGLPTTQL